MYGQIHCVIRELVQTKFGNEAWDTILKKSALDEHTSFLMFTRYDDASTFNLVGAVSETLGVPVEAVLEIFGEFFFDYCLRHGYDKMLRTLGSDIKSFIQNLDSLHSLLALSYKGIAAPSFRCEDGHDGELILHYYSGRPGLYPIVKGVLKAVARDLFDQSVEMTVIEQNKEDIGCNQSQEHTAFRVFLRSESRTSERASPDGSTSESRDLVEFNPEKILLRATDFCSAFPYHIIFDRDLRIRQCGDLIRKHSNTILTEGMPLTKAFSIVHPRMVLTIENIRKFINAVFLLSIKPAENGKRTFLLKGQMIWLSDTKNMIFIGSPRLTSLNELMEMNVYLADIPLYDVTRELVLLNQQRIAEIDIAKRLDETTAELKKTSQALEEEKSKTETLLHQMLPRKVAKALTHGRRVEAEKFDQVTILFSDIVTFTNIASACTPMDIVNMLNEMYQRFDARTSQHNVYKVETIGDAYMIVSGVPEKTTFHAQPVANFAMDMIEDAGLVRSPATGLPLQIRVGVHTGPVVAGVVGVKMPRYCLFGDTVNTASRMESHGVPGRIHISPTTYLALRGWGYAFKHRGEMEVKGKGVMSTYFLCGHLNRRLDDSQDECNVLDIFQDDTENGDHIEWSRTESQDNLDQVVQRTNYHKSVPFHEVLRGSESETNNEELPNLFPSSDREHSPGKESVTNIYPISQHEAAELPHHFQSDSSQSLTSSSSQNRLTRNRKMYKSSNESIRVLQDQNLETTVDSPKLVSKNNAQASAGISHSITHTSSEESTFGEDCLYINGSFRNEFRERNYVGSKDSQGTNESVDIQDIPKLEMCTDKHFSSNKLNQQEHSHTTNKSIKNKPTDCDNVSNPSNIRTIFEDKTKVSVVSSPRTTLPSDCIPAMPKSETFSSSVPLNPIHQIKQSSTSLYNLEKQTSDTKVKRGKKHRSSKLCSIF